MPSASSNNNRDSTPVVQDDWFGDLIGALLTGVGHLLWWAIRFPLIGTPAALSLAMGCWRGPHAALFTAAGFVAVFTLWGFLDEDSLQAWVIDPPSHYFLRWSRYERSWSKVCALHGLTATHGGREIVPVLYAISIGAHIDVLEVSVVTGQSMTNWNKQSEALATTWRAQRVTFTTLAPGRLRVSVIRTDGLAEPVGLPTAHPGEAVDLAGLPVGVTETGAPWRLPVWGHHVLVAGATGAGKGSVLWSLIAALGPEVATGRVRLCVIDPKGGMELGAGAPMFSAFTHDNAEHTVALLRALVALLQTRANRLRGHTRLHIATPAAPLYVVVIDEIAALTAYVTDRKIRTEIEQLLGLLLSQGRAVGISVVAAVQDPSKDTLPVRQLFTVRIGLRLTEASQTAMVLGQGARDAGAVCDQIADTTPGVGYVMVDGTAQPTRVRAYHVTDDDITRMAATFPASRAAGTQGPGPTAGTGGASAHTDGNRS
ncbi:FtsK/SpoIIIE domain-containing protein [Mycolicibacterium sp. Y3]